LTVNKADSYIQSVKVTDFGFDNNNTQYHVKATGKMNTMFMGLIGYPTMDVGAYSEVDVGGSALEVALVLDTTGSMNMQNRLTGLKVAAKDLVQNLLQNKDAGAYLKIGIVPFANYANVGLANRNKTWIDVPADYDDPQSCGPTYPNAVYGNCHLVPYSYQSCTGGNDGSPQTCTTVSGSSNQCDVLDYGTPVQQCWAGAHHAWNGAVGSRTNDAVITTGDKYPGIMDAAAPNEIIDLTDNMGKLVSGIETLNADGETYIPSGLLWGWNLLDSAEPYSTAKSAASMATLKGAKALVLMTDGDNTKSAQIPKHDGTDGAAADLKTAQLCSNIKAAGISIYTVAFKVEKATSLAMLKNCASNPSQAFDAQDNTALQSVFNQIAGSLASMRLSK
jgi:Mg-chelatase subunit ChlD